MITKIDTDSMSVMEWEDRLSGSWADDFFSDLREELETLPASLAYMTGAELFEKMLLWFGGAADLWEVNRMVRFCFGVEFGEER